MIKYIDAEIEKTQHQVVDSKSLAMDSLKKKYTQNQQMTPTVAKVRKIACQGKNVKTHAPNMGARTGASPITIIMLEKA